MTLQQIHLKANSISNQVEYVPENSYDTKHKKIIIDASDAIYTLYNEMMGVTGDINLRLECDNFYKSVSRNLFSGTVQIARFKILKQLNIIA